MKKLRTLAPAAALLLSAAMLISCDSDVVYTGGVADTTTKPPTIGPHAYTTVPKTEPVDEPGVVESTEPEPYDPFSALFHRYDPIGDLEGFKGSCLNLTEKYYDEMDLEHTLYSSFDYQVDADAELFAPENPPNLFDGDPTTKWCCSGREVEGCSAVVWSMTRAVNVLGYTITTGNDNAAYTNRNPIQWRLYGANELPKERMDESVPLGNGWETDHFGARTVPDGWELIDAVDASVPGDPLSSLIPDENFYEVGFKAENPGVYRYFMLLIDYCEDGAFQLSEFTLYGREFRYHAYEEIEDLYNYIESHENLTEQYLNSWDEAMSVFYGFDYIETDDWDELFPEGQHKILDGRVETKWCGIIENGVSVVWSMTDSVSVTGYSITTANDNSSFTNRNPVKWRLYGANELPSARMDELVDGEHDYFSLQTVPDGWVLIDAVDASDPNDPDSSLLPDLDFYEVGFEAENPGSYRYFMLIVDECESIIQMSEFTLYGFAD